MDVLKLFATMTIIFYFNCWVMVQLTIGLNLWEGLTTNCAVHNAVRHKIGDLSLSNFSDLSAQP